jgi:hypothetical protein
MKLLKKIKKLFKDSNHTENHPHDIDLEQKMHENALAEIELREE